MDFISVAPDFLNAFVIAVSKLKLQVYGSFYNDFRIIKLIFLNLLITLYVCLPVYSLL